MVGHTSTGVCSALATEPDTPGGQCFLAQLTRNWTVTTQLRSWGSQPLTC